MRSLRNIFRLGIKEIFSVASDPVLIGLILYTFTVAIYMVANNVKTEVVNAAIAVVDEDGSLLSERISGAFLQPYFQPADSLTFARIDPAMDAGDYTFVLVIPEGFQSDVIRGRVPQMQLNIDATAMTLAGNGAAYIQSIAQDEIARFLSRGPADSALPVTLTVRAAFNPNLQSAWFMATMQIVSNVTILSIILAGAAVIRERERGTIEHLLVMPVTPFEIMVSKVWANGLVIVIATILSLHLVVQLWLGVPLAGSIGLFLLGEAAYLFSVTALGITLATLARTMPQFGLLSIPVFVVLNLLSGGITPLESMPGWLQVVMQLSPATHFNQLTQAVLFRGAGIAIVWPQFLAITGLGVAFFGVALIRFRRSMAGIH